MANYLQSLIDQGDKIWSGIRLVKDSWQNVVTGLGTARDKTQYGEFAWQNELSWTELNNLFHHDDLAKKVVSLKPKEMIREGYEVLVDDKEKINNRIKEIPVISSVHQVNEVTGINEAVLQSMIWGRLYGGAVLIIGADDGLTADQELAEERVQEIKWLYITDRRYLVPEGEHYRVIDRKGSGDLYIHKSRLIVFGGALTSDDEKDRLGGWDYSVLQAPYNALRQSGQVWQAVEHLVSDSSQAVFKIQGLMSMIAGGQKDILQSRMELVDLSRSVARAVLLDTDGGESFERQVAPMTEYKGILEMFMMRLAAAADMPVSVLMGRSPAGLNATGESDIRIWYDTIRSAQTYELQPKLEKLIKLVLIEQLGRIPESWSIKFNPLWQMTPKEQSELEKITAEKDAIYISNQVVLPEEVALSRFTPDGWMANTEIDRELRERLLVDEKDLLENPPPPPPQLIMALSIAFGTPLALSKPLRHSRGIAPEP